MTTRLAIAILLFSLSSCGGEAEVSEREEYWSKSVASFFGSKRTLDELHGWLRENGRYYTFDESEVTDGHWTIVLETIYVDTFFCEAWMISLDTSIDQTGVIRDYAISKHGRCL